MYNYCHETGALAHSFVHWFIWVRARTFTQTPSARRPNRARNQKHTDRERDIHQTVYKYQHAYYCVKLNNTSDVVLNSVFLSPSLPSCSASLSISLFVGLFSTEKKKVVNFFFLFLLQTKHRMNDEEKAHTIQHHTQQQIHRHLQKVLLNTMPISKEMELIHNHRPTTTTTCIAKWKRKRKKSVIFMK